LAQVPILRPALFDACVWDPAAADLDVAALHGAWLQAFRQRGGEIHCRQRVEGLQRVNDSWRVVTGSEVYESPVIVNAAGAWADAIAAMAGLAPLGLQPRRRSMAVVPLAPGLDASHWPLTVDIGEQWYFKSETGRLLVSPADEALVDPCDAFADDIDIAAGIERFEAATTLVVDRVTTSWAGLRCFFADRSPVLGRDPRVPGFFWSAGLGGYGIQTSPAASLVVASAILGQEVPPALTRVNVTPDRFIYRI
jgi:D-arginine dehydrogenase